MLPLPPVVVPVAALDLVRGGGGAPAEAVGKRRRRHARDGTCQHDRRAGQTGRMPQAAVDELVDAARPRADRGQHLPGRQPGRGAPARLRRPGGRPGARRRGPHRRPGRRPRPLAARVLPAPGRPEHPDPLRGRPHPRRPVVHHPAGRGHPARQGRSSTCRRRSTSTRTASTTRSRCRRRARRPTTLPDFQDAHGRRARTSWATGTTGLARSTPATSTGRRPTASEPLPPYQRVWLRADGALPDDPCCTPACVTYASDMTLLDTTLLPHGGAVARRAADDGEPRPRDVVPPARSGPTSGCCTTRTRRRRRAAAASPAA